MDENNQIDKLDKEILTILLNDARTPYLEIARQLLVAGGTIHQRIDKLKNLGIIEGSKIQLNLAALGYDVTVFLGIHLKSSKDSPLVIEELTKLSEVVEAYYTTGHYALLVKIHTKSISDFHLFLTNKLQTIDGIQATESFISLHQPIFRSVTL
jgi:Lrp/AsnC family transcriptional regulator, regulator for asnA, asnC and gidA